MQPAERGRFCASCQKTVVDFSAMSDAEVARYFSTHRGPLCGRFTAGQLDRDLREPRKPLPWLRGFFTATLPAFLLSLKASAQEGRLPAPVEVAPGAAAGGTAPAQPEKGSISGVVRDAQGNDIPFATIVVKGTRNGVTADAGGRFTVPDIHFPAVLQVSCVGYQPYEFPVTGSQEAAAITLIMEHRMMMGEVVVVHTRRRKAPKAQPKPAPIAAATPVLRAYPNPVAAGAPLTIDGLHLETGRYRLELYTVAGQRVHAGTGILETTTSKMTLPTPGMLPGTYLLRVTHEKSGRANSLQVVLTD